MTFSTQHRKPLISSGGIAGAPPGVNYTRWYFRAGSPSDQPNYVNTSTYYGTFWIPPQGSQGLWTTPTPSTVNSTPKILLSTAPNPAAPGTSADPLSAGTQYYDWSGIGARFVGAPLQAQTVPAWRYRIGFCTWDINGPSAGFTQFQLLVYRPGTGIVSTTIESGAETARSWGRYIPRTWIVYIDATSFAAQAGDRFVIDIILNSDAGGIIGVTIGPKFQYDGAYDGFVNGAFKPPISIASYIDFPNLSYQSMTP